mgnify:CR=1 FL=1
MPMGNDDCPRFVIDEVPGSDQYTWCLLGTHGEVLARAPQAYDTREEAQVAIASVRLAARESEVPTAKPTSTDKIAA